MEDLNTPFDHFVSSDETTPEGKGKGKELVTDYETSSSSEELSSDDSFEEIDLYEFEVDETFSTATNYRKKFKKLDQFPFNCLAAGNEEYTLFRFQTYLLFQNNDIKNNPYHKKITVKRSDGDVDICGGDIGKLFIDNTKHKQQLINKSIHRSPIVIFNQIENTLNTQSFIDDVAIRSLLGRGVLETLFSSDFYKVFITPPPYWQGPIPKQETVVEYNDDDIFEPYVKITHTHQVFDVVLYPLEEDGSKTDKPKKKYRLGPITEEIRIYNNYFELHSITIPTTSKKGKSTSIFIKKYLELAKFIDELNKSTPKISADKIKQILYCYSNSTEGLWHRITSYIKANKKNPEYMQLYPYGHKQKFIKLYREVVQAKNPIDSPEKNQMLINLVSIPQPARIRILKLLRGKFKLRWERFTNCIWQMRVDARNRTRQPEEAEKLFLQYLGGFLAFCETEVSEESAFAVIQGVHNRINVPNDLSNKDHLLWGRDNSAFYSFLSVYAYLHAIKGKGVSAGLKDYSKMVSPVFSADKVGKLSKAFPNLENTEILTKCIESIQAQKQDPEAEKILSRQLIIAMAHHELKFFYKFLVFYNPPIARDSKGDIDEEKKNHVEKNKKLINSCYNKKKELADSFLSFASYCSSRHLLCKRFIHWYYQDLNSYHSSEYVFALFRDLPLESRESFTLAFIQAWDNKVRNDLLVKVRALKDKPEQLLKFLNSFLQVGISQQDDDFVINEEQQTQYLGYYGKNPMSLPFGMPGAVIPEASNEAAVFAILAGNTPKNLSFTDYASISQVSRASRYAMFNKNPGTQIFSQVTYLTRTKDPQRVLNFFSKVENQLQRITRQETAWYNGLSSIWKCSNVRRLNRGDRIERFKHPESKQILAYIPSGTTYFVGDLHGDWYAFEQLLQFLNKIDFFNRVKNGEKIYLVFLGDYVDRGKYSLEVLTGVLLLQHQLPYNVLVIRGNHETEEIAQRDGFGQQLLAKFSQDNATKVFQISLQIFEQLTLMGVTPDGIMAVHGGIPFFPETDSPKTLYDVLRTKYVYEPVVCWKRVPIKKNQEDKGKQLQQQEQERPVEESEKDKEKQPQQQKPLEKDVRSFNRVNGILWNDPLFLRAGESEYDYKYRSNEWNEIHKKTPIFRDGYYYVSLGRGIYYTQQAFYALFGPLGFDKILRAHQEKAGPEVARSQDAPYVSTIFSTGGENNVHSGDSRRCKVPYIAKFTPTATTQARLQFIPFFQQNYQSSRPADMEGVIRYLNEFDSCQLALKILQRNYNLETKLTDYNCEHQRKTLDDRIIRSGLIPDGDDAVVLPRISTSIKKNEMLMGRADSFLLICQMQILHDRDFWRFNYTTDKLRVFSNTYKSLKTDDKSYFISAYKYIEMIASEFYEVASSNSARQLFDRMILFICSIPLKDHRTNTPILGNHIIHINFCQPLSITEKIHLVQYFAFILCQDKLQKGLQALGVWIYVFERLRYLLRLLCRIRDIQMPPMVQGFCKRVNGWDINFAKMYRNNPAQVEICATGKNSYRYLLGMLKIEPSEDSEGFVQDLPRMQSFILSGSNTLLSFDKTDLLVKAIGRYNDQAAWGVFAEFWVNNVSNSECIKINNDTGRTSNKEDSAIHVFQNKENVVYLYNYLYEFRATEINSRMKDIFSINHLAQMPRDISGRVYHEIEASPFLIKETLVLDLNKRCPCWRVKNVEIRDPRVYDFLVRNEYLHADEVYLRQDTSSSSSSTC